MAHKNGQLVSQDNDHKVVIKILRKHQQILEKHEELLEKFDGRISQMERTLKASEKVKISDDIEYLKHEVKKCKEHRLYGRIH